MSAFSHRAFLWLRYAGTDYAAPLFFERHSRGDTRRQHARNPQIQILEIDEEGILSIPPRPCRRLWHRVDRFSGLAPNRSNCVDVLITYRGPFCASSKKITGNFCKWAGTKEPRHDSRPIFPSRTYGRLDALSSPAGLALEARTD